MKAKAVIPIFKAIDELTLIDEGYAETFTKSGDLALFISNVTNLPFNKDDVAYWTPDHEKHSRFSQDELGRHKKALKKLLI